MLEGNGHGHGRAAACATLGERDIILNGTVLTAAIRCIPCTECYALPAVPMNSVDDCNEQREERVQEGIAGPRLVRSDLICDHILHTVPVVLHSQQTS